jgi:hypothetical protein
VKRALSRIATLLAITFSCALLAAPAHAAECVTTSSSYVGNGVNGAVNVNYTVLTITQTGACTWTVPAGVKAADVLVVGGGGGGAGGYIGYIDGAGGGGGGGAYRADAYPLTPGASISVVVGAGGKGGDSVTVSTRDSSVGSRGATSIFGAISGGGGGGAGYSTVYDSQTGLSGTAGGGSGGSSQFWNAYNSGTYYSVSYKVSGGSGQNATVGAVTYTGVSGGKGAIYYSSGTSGSAGGGRGDATDGAASEPGAGLSDTITGTSVVYGKGGLVKGSSGWSAGLAAQGYGHGGTGGSNNNRGTNGGDGIVIIRFASSGFNSFGLAGNVTLATYRTSIGISINTTAPSIVTFIANGKRIAGCLNIKTTGSAPNIVATCSWRPSLIGQYQISAIATPTAGGLPASPAPVVVSVSKRSGNR